MKWRGSSFIKPFLKEMLPARCDKFYRRDAKTLLSSKRLTFLAATFTSGKSGVASSMKCTYFILRELLVSVVNVF